MTRRLTRRMIAVVGAAALAASALVFAAPAEAAVLTYTGQGHAIVDGDTPVSTVGATINAVGKASVYPLTATVPTDNNGVITRLRVSVNGLTHPSPQDLDLLMVGPGGQQTWLLSDVGGANAVSNISLQLSDEAASPLPTTVLASGTYRPTNLNGGDADAMPAPAPAAGSNTSLSVYNGTRSAGVWSFYLVDDAVNNAGSLTSITLWIEQVPVGYPSKVDVSGLTGTVQDVNVTMTGVTHTYPGDIQAMLVSPSGQSVMLLDQNGNGTDLTNGTLTFDDESAVSLPSYNAPLLAGTYKPSGAVSYLPEPPGSSTNKTLAAFDGVNPNGTWKLYVYDGWGGDRGSFTGWSLTLDTADKAAPQGGFAISGGADYTRSSTVTLNLNAVDLGIDASGVTQVRASNDGVNFSAWQAYAPAISWAVPKGDGVKKVWVQYADAAGNLSPVVADKIVLDTVSPTVVKYKPTKRATAKAKVKVWFSEQMRASTVTARTVTLKLGTTKIKAKVSYNPLKRMVIVKPKKKLARGKYTASVSTRVLDLAGNKFDAKPAKRKQQKLTWSFRVR